MKIIKKTTFHKVYLQMNRYWYKCTSMPWLPTKSILTIGLNCCPHYWLRSIMTFNGRDYMLSLVYTSVADCRRQSPTVLSLEQATTGVIASCRSNALELSESINSRPTERQNDSSSEFKFKCKFEFEFKFLYWVVFTPRNNITCAFWMATHIVSV